MLEIGSGNNPNPRSDILCDRYIHDNRERAGEFDIVIDRPMVVADGYRLPFADKTFDYVICSHVLEHMSNPKAFITEVSRVGKVGYIEVPSAISERVFGWDFHHWYCEKKGKTLVLQEKTEGERFGGFFHRLIASQIWFRRFFEVHEDTWYVRIEWKETMPLRAIGPMGQSQIRALDERAWKLLQSAKPELYRDALFFIAWMWRRLVRKIRKEVKRIIWGFQRQVFPIRIVSRLLLIVVCPSCKGRLQLLRVDLICPSCKSRYPMENGIPILLLPDVRQTGY